MRKYIYFIALICCALSASTSYAQKKVIKTMMIAGQDGSHYWRGACEAMKQILENSGMFKVDFVFTPDFGGDINTFKPDFAKYNLVVVNYGGEVWPEPVQKAFEKMVAPNNAHLSGPFTIKQPKINRNMTNAPTYTGPAVHGWSPKYCGNCE